MSHPAVKRYRMLPQKFFLFLVFLFLYSPIVILILFSFNDSPFSARWHGATFKWYGLVWKNSSLLLTLSRSLLVAVVSSFFTILLALPAALVSARAFSRINGSLRLALMCSLILPDLVMGITTLTLFSCLHWNMGLHSIIVAHVTFCLPFAFFIITARLRNQGIALEEAATDLGASPMQVFFKITWPNLRPAVWASLLLCISLSLDDVVVSFFTAGPSSTTLPLKIQSMLKIGLNPQVNALFTLILICIVLIVGICAILKTPWKPKTIS